MQKITCPKDIPLCYDAMLKKISFEAQEQDAVSGEFLRCIHPYISAQCAGLKRGE